MGSMLTTITILALAQSTTAPEANAADASAAKATAKFAAPEMLMAAGAPMGDGLLYPSPELRDMNGDGHADIVIGDLWGNLRIATSQTDGDTISYSKLAKLKASDGTELKFENW